MTNEKVKLKENVVSLFLEGKDYKNEEVQRAAVQLSGMRDREFPLMGEYSHARDGMVVVIEYDGIEYTLPARFVDIVRPARSAKKRKCAA
jgi:hypothetical protein